MRAHYSSYYGSLKSKVRNSGWLHRNRLKVGALCSIFRGDPEFGRINEFVKIAETVSVAKATKHYEKL